PIDDGGGDSLFLKGDGNRDRGLAVGNRWLTAVRRVNAEGTTTKMEAWRGERKQVQTSNPIRAHVFCFQNTLFYFPNTV
ncbi:hypothetical protein A2U01_0080954, partial [Trifolium medium]|nr:hypothetical protein [Trifolium medium]